MADQSLFLSSPYFLPIIVVGVIIALVFMFTQNKKKKGPDFKPQEFSKTIIHDLKKNVDIHGMGFPMLVKATLWNGMKEIGVIDKFYYGKGKFAEAFFDEKEKTIKTEGKDKDKQFDLLFMRMKGPTIIHRIFGLGKFYLVLQTKDETGKDLVVYDQGKYRMFLPKNTHLTSYGDVWTNCNDGIEFINNISVKRMSEEIMMHLENTPDRVVHIEIEQAKKERTGRTYMQLEKAKYEERKDAEDTVIG